MGLLILAQMGFSQGNGEFDLQVLASYQSGVFDEGAVEIAAYDPDTKRVFFTNADANTIGVLDITYPHQPVLISEISQDAYGDGVNSVAVKNGVVAVAVEAEAVDANGLITFWSTDGDFITSVEVGVLPDMVTFTPDGQKVLVANEGEPSDDYMTDPEGSVSIIDISGGVMGATATQVSFSDYNDDYAHLLNKGVRLFGPNASTAQDLEPEYITVSPDNKWAYVGLQENNAFALINLESNSLVDIYPLGTKDHSSGTPSLQEYILNETEGWPELGTPVYDGGQDPVMLGGFSGLYFDPTESSSDEMVFYAIPDRGPNGDAVGRGNVTPASESNLRPFKLPDYQGRFVKFSINRNSGDIQLLEQVLLTQKDGKTPITGRGNIPGWDETPVTYADANTQWANEDFVDGNGQAYHQLNFDPYGGDFEGILRDSNGDFWMCDEYRPAIYQFSPDGQLKERYVPRGTSTLGSTPQPAGFYGSETLPEVYSKRRANRGFEAIALDTDTGILYAFIQTPLYNPNSSTRNQSDVIRVLGINPADGMPVSEYVYLLERNRNDGLSLGRVDKIGDAVYVGNGQFMILERDSSVPGQNKGKKYVFKFDLKGATNILGTALSLKTESTGPNDKTLEMMTADDLWAAGITPVTKTKVVNLPSIGYLPSDKPEGIALLPNGSIAVINDNDFGLAGAGVSDMSSLGIISFGDNNGFDASNRSADVDITNRPTQGYFMPDAIASYEVDGELYIVTVNEGDSRDYDGYSEEERIGDVILDPEVFPNAATLQLEENLGRLNMTTASGDLDGDGDFDVLHSYGARSFTIWDQYGNLLFDSGDELERKTFELLPDNFNSTNDDNDSRKNRSDDKGPEPEAVEIARIGDQIYALIGLERIGGIMVYNVTDPQNPTYVSYVNNRNFDVAAETPEAGDLGVESLVFVPAEQSPTKNPLVIAGNEVSGSLTLFSVNEAKTDILFDEEIAITDFEPTKMVVPPSPLKTQVVFVGGHDIVETTPTYGNPQGRAVAKEWHDFIGFTPDDSGESIGWVTVNHEMIYRDDHIGDGGGMTAFRIERTRDGKIGVVDQTLEDGREGKFFNVDFVNTVGETGMNCGGIIGPNGRIWTAEEWFRGNTSSIWNGNFRGADRPDSWNPHNPAPMTQSYGVRDTSDFTVNAPEFPIINGMTIKKYQNFNYMTEVDPKQAKAIRKQYNWGRAGWEGGAISNDGKYVYLGIDGSPAPWVRFTADVAFDFTEGALEVYKHDNPAGQRWIEVPMNEENILGGLTNYAWSVGATMYVRNEWVTIDRKTGIIYWTETGRDSRSSGPGILFNALTSSTNAVVAPHHQTQAMSLGLANALDENYQDYYGRVLYYDPSTEEVGVAVNGGPYFASSPDLAEYPAKHLSNPDGLSVMEIDGQNFLMIQEDLNGSSFGRTPAGISNRLCELYLLDIRNIPASVDDLIRVTAVPQGAEITGAVQVDERTILVNSQHPNADNPFPYNHSLTLAIHGFDQIEVDGLGEPDPDQLKRDGLAVNPLTREVYLDEVSDYALYNDQGHRLKVYRQTNQFEIGELSSGDYFVQNARKELFKLTIQ